MPSQVDERHHLARPGNVLSARMCAEEAVIQNLSMGTQLQGKKHDESSNFGICPKRDCMARNAILHKRVMLHRTLILTQRLCCPIELVRPVAVS